MAHGELVLPMKTILEGSSSPLIKGPSVTVHCWGRGPCILMLTDFSWE